MTHLPEYEKPPVIEVVTGVLFKDLRALEAVHLGFLWHKYKDQYDHSKEMPPLAPVIEGFDGQTEMLFQLTDTPPLPRTWLLTPRENAIVQVQRDRFLHNWKKVDDCDQYPRYSKVIAAFKDRLGVFESFVNEFRLGEIEPLQYEMTYVNHIPEGDGWRGIDQISNVFPDLSWRGGTRFLSELEQLNGRSSFSLPDKQGRLHATIRLVRQRDAKALLVLELTARGMPKDSSRASMWAWFDLAREWIVRGFTDLTGAEVRKNVWRQTR